jgi:hypothetical protein
MKRTIIIVILIVIAVVAYGFGKNRQTTTDTGPVVMDQKTYSSDEYGISFSYPPGYFLEEKDIDVSHRVHNEIILTEDTEWNRKVRSGEVADTEGPTAITIDIYQNNLDNMSARSFITGTSDSNYKLGDGAIATSTRGRLTGLEYTWSGLYEGRSFVIATPRYVYMFSVTRLDPADEIPETFDRLMETVQIAP